MNYCIRGGGFDGEQPFFIAEYFAAGERVYLRCGRVDGNRVKRFDTYESALEFLAYLEDLQFSGRLPMWHYLEVANEFGEVVDE